MNGKKQSQFDASSSINNNELRVAWSNNTAVGFPEKTIDNFYRGGWECVQCSFHINIISN